MRRRNLKVENRFPTLFEQEEVPHIELVADAAFWVLYDAHLAGGPETDAVLATGIWASWEGLRDQALVGLFRAARDIAT
jgi:hypothetical protein